LRRSLTSTKKAEGARGVGKCLWGVVMKKIKNRYRGKKPDILDQKMR